jgi:hypothetical protein
MYLPPEPGRNQIIIKNIGRRGGMLLESGSGSASN